MIGDLISTLSDAQKLSIAQIQKAVQDGTLPAYVGIPLLQDKVKQRNEAAALLMGQKPKQPKVAEQVMAAAQQAVGLPSIGGPAAPIAAGEETEQAMPSEGLESLSSNLPQEYAGGGIIAFSGEEGSVVPEGGMYPEEEEEEEPATAASVSQFRRDFPAAGQAPRQLTPQTGISGLSMTPGRLWDRAVNYFTPQSPEAYAKKKQEIVGTPKPVTPAVATPDIIKGIVDTPEQIRSGLTSKPTAGARHAARTQQAIGALLGAKETPESTIAAAPPKEDTTIADEIARSRGERADMMKMILGDQAADKKEAEENKWLSLAKAGFGIAGGRSPYAMVNIGEGMSGGIGDIMAAKQAARKEQQGKIQAAAEYDAKSQQLENSLREMGIAQQHYKSMEPYYQAQAQHSAQQARLAGAQADLYPQLTAAKMAKMAHTGSGGAGPKASLDLNEYKYFATERPAQLMKDPAARANLPGLKDPPGSPNRLRAEAALQSWARKKAIAEQNEYLTRNAKQPVGNLMTPTQ